MKNNIIILGLFALLFSSCTKTKYFNASEECKRWFKHSGSNDVEMIDNNGIINTYRYADIETSYLEQGMDLFYMPVSRSFYEYIRQETKSDFGDKISFSATANSEGMPLMYLGFNNLSLFWHDGDTIPSSIGIEKNGDMTSLNLNHSNTINSTITYHDALTINGIVYNDVMRIKIDDLQLHWDMNTPTEIVFAKDYCIVAYTLNNEIIFQRIGQDK